MTERRRGVAILTGVGRRRGIAAAIALGLAEDGWDLALPVWTPYDRRLGIGGGADDVAAIVEDARSLGAAVTTIEADLADVDAPRAIVAAAAAGGGCRALVMSHSESIDSGILDTSVEAWDRHFAVNSRAAWLLIKHFAEQLPDAPSPDTTGRIVALTSDHTAFNLPYGASKGALDRLVQAAAVELGPRGIRANLVNPGPIDTGWMNDEVRAACLAETPAGRLGTPADTADLVRFLLSDRGGWISGQVLHSNGAFHVG
jgi:3-oxoacyl-[acyl-carrier protein] reductase